MPIKNAFDTGKKNAFDNLCKNDISIFYRIWIKVYSDP